MCIFKGESLTHLQERLKFTPSPKAANKVIVRHTIAASIYKTKDTQVAALQYIPDYHIIFHLLCQRFWKKRIV